MISIAAGLHPGHTDEFNPSTIDDLHVAIDQLSPLRSVRSASTSSGRDMTPPTRSDRSGPKLSWRKR